MDKLLVHDNVVVHDKFYLTPWAVRCQHTFHAQIFRDLTMSNQSEREKQRKLRRDRMPQVCQGVSRSRKGGRASTPRRPNAKRYDTPMIKDYLSQLKLELKLRLAADVALNEKLETESDLAAAIAATQEPSPLLVAEIDAYQKQYQSALTLGGTIDGTNASADEVKQFAKTFLTHSIRRRERQILQLDGLGDLFEESLIFAERTLSVTYCGEIIHPQRVYHVRELLDGHGSRATPSYEDLLPNFLGHALAAESIGPALKGAAVVIVRAKGCEKMLVLLGLAEYLRWANHRDIDLSGILYEVCTAEELQFLGAAVREFCGWSDYDGDPWQDFAALSQSSQASRPGRLP